MALSTMETTPPVAEPSAFDEVDQYSAPPTASYAPAARSTWTSDKVQRVRRMWTAALSAALLVTAGGLGMLYVDDTNYQNSTRALTTETEQLNGQNQNLQTALTTTQHELTTSQGQVSTLTTELAHPTLGIWNVPQTITGPDFYLGAGVPDTFTYHLKLTSSGPIRVSIMSIKQFGAAVSCVENGRGNTNYCMYYSGSEIGWLNVTSVSYDFHKAEGCAAYIAVITASSRVTVTPDVSVTYNPAPSATGACV